MRHPAKFSDAVLEAMAPYLWSQMTLDPMAGVGRLTEILGPFCFLNELEPEWAALCHATGAAVTVADARRLPYRDRCFDTICTSPTYGNRMADHHNARDASTRHTYRHSIGHRLHPNNTGQLQWGTAYRKAHVEIWKECYRVLHWDGQMIINLSDHIRAGVQVGVVSWHYQVLRTLGLDLVEAIRVPTPRQRHGANGHLRANHEVVLVFHKS